MDFVEIMEKHLCGHGTSLDVSWLEPSRRFFPLQGNFWIQLLSQSGCQHRDISVSILRPAAPPASDISFPFVHPFLSLFALSLAVSLSLTLPMLCVVFRLFLVPIPSSLLPHPPLSTLPSVRRCGKHHVLSFPQCSAGCHCRRWTPSRQLCLCWALCLTVRGHSPRTGNLWKLPFWQPSPQVSF